MSEKEKENNNTNEEEVIELDKNLDNEAWDVIVRLYDKTFKDLVDR